MAPRSRLSSPRRARSCGCSRRTSKIERTTMSTESLPLHSGVATPERATPPPDTNVSRTRLVLVLLAAELGMLLAALDQTIVGTAMPHILADLNGFEHYTWVSTAYLLAATVM